MQQEAKGQLKRQEVERINLVEAELAKEPSSTNLIDSLGNMWDRLNMPMMSSHYYELVAEKKQDEKSWIDAAFRYYDAFKISKFHTGREFYGMLGIQPNDKKQCGEIQ